MHLLALTVLSSLLSSTLAASGSFDILTINVAGLPEILNGNGETGDKTTNSEDIGTDLTNGGYKIVHVQEDFNYHAALYSTSTIYPYRTATSGGVPFGSGLNTLSYYPFADLDRVTWDKCYVNQGDCLTPKGFTYMRMTIADGAVVDLYNLHADAGNMTQDAAARSSDVDQVLAYMAKYSAGHAVIIAGDTNDRYTNTNVSISRLVDQGGLRDAWVDLINGGVRPKAGSPANACPDPAPNNACEVVDKVLYRSGEGVELNATAFAYVTDSFLQADGDVLTDHNPLRVMFDFTTD